MTQPNYVLAGTNCDPPADWLSWIIEGQLLAGPYPGSSNPQEHRTKIQTLVDARITTIINLMEDPELVRFAPYEATVRELTAEQVRFLQFPIHDVSVPTLELMASILDAIDESLRQRSPVYMHCWGGVGRTGTVIGCWLLRHGLATPDDVLAKLARLRKQDKVRGKREAPETPEQRQFVRAWATVEFRR